MKLIASLILLCTFTASAADNRPIEEIKREARERMTALAGLRPPIHTFFLRDREKIPLHCAYAPNGDLVVNDAEQFYRYRGQNILPGFPLAAKASTFAVHPRTSEIFYAPRFEEGLLSISLEGRKEKRPGFDNTTLYGLTNIAITSDGRHTAVYSAEGGISVYETTKGQIVARLPGAQKPIGQAAFSADGRYLASTWLGQLHLWEISTRDHFSISIPGNPSFASLSLSPDGRYIAIPSADAMAIFDSTTKSFVGAYANPVGLNLFQAFPSVTWSHGGSRLTWAHPETGAYVLSWNVPAQIPDELTPRQIPSPAANPNCVAYSPDGSALAVGYKGEIQVYPTLRLTRPPLEFDPAMAGELTVRMWESLGSEGGLALRIASSVMKAGDATVPFLRGHLLSMFHPAPSTEDIGLNMRALGHEQFRSRDGAHRWLETQLRLEEFTGMQPRVRNALEAGLRSNSAEVSRRCQHLLNGVDLNQLSLGAQRIHRSVELLEALRTRESFALLAELSNRGWTVARQALARLPASLGEPARGPGLHWRANQPRQIE